MSLTHTLLQMLRAALGHTCPVQTDREPRPVTMLLSPYPTPCRDGPNDPEVPRPWPILTWTFPSLWRIVLDLHRERRCTCRHQSELAFSVVVRWVRYMPRRIAQSMASRS